MAKIRWFVFAFLFFVSTAEAGEVYYIPTPYPLKRAGGSSMPQDLKVIHTWSGWFGNVYNRKLVQDGTLLIGGWGDTYSSLLRFDLTGLPKQVNIAGLWLYAIPSGISGALPSQLAMYPITTDWDPATVGWGTGLEASDGLAWVVSTSTNIWRGYEITNWYNEWKSGARPDKGLWLWPNNQGDGRTQRFDKFVSPKSPNDYLRPVLQLKFNDPVGMPSFKMPVPGGARWLLTNEIGGYECMGAPPLPDIAHQNNSYFSIDISPTNVKDNGSSSYTGNIPVIAAASGKVAYVETNPNVPNGYHIVLNHSGGTSTTSGWTTKSIHLKDRPRRSDGTLLAVGDTVSRGDQIGIMGTTGRLSDGTPTSTGVHLHFGIYYNGSGASSVAELSYATVDGWLMKSFQTECRVNSSGVPTAWTRYYRSSNRLY